MKHDTDLAPPARSPLPLSSSEAASSFHSARSHQTSHTLVGSGHPTDDEEETLADSIVDSMHSCADTLVDSAEEVTLHGEGDGDTDVEDLLSERGLSPEDHMARLRRMHETPTPTKGT